MNEKRAKLLAIKDDLNVLVDFLAKRDIEKLTSNILEEKYKISKVDLLILRMILWMENLVSESSTTVILLQKVALIF